MRTHANQPMGSVAPGRQSLPKTESKLQFQFEVKGGANGSANKVVLVESASRIHLPTKAASGINLPTMSQVRSVPDLKTGTHDSSMYASMFEPLNNY